MPIYEQRCKKCGHQFEVLVSHSDRTKIQPCRECGNGQTIRVVSRSSFALKGGGWAKDGYGSDK
jgi:putative FmdB family regulatory protein